MSERNSLAKVAKYAGRQKQVDDLVTAMSRAAEAAVPEARALLRSAVRSMSVTSRAPATAAINGLRHCATRSQPSVM